MARMTSVAAALMVLAAPAAVEAQAWPSRPVQITMPFAAGGAPDLLSRALAEGMAPVLGQPVVVVNRDGAGGTIGAAQVAAARPDGYTLGFSAAGPLVQQPHLRRALSYTLESFDAICQTFELHVVLAVNAESPMRSFADFIAAARARPGTVTVGHSGPASLPHLAVSQLEALGGFTVNHIAYRGDGQLMQNLAGRHVDVAAAGLGSIAGQNARPLAVFAAERLGTHPDIPTVTELGFRVQRFAIGGLYAPRGLPAEVKGSLERACAQGVQSAPYRALSERLGQPPRYLDSAAFASRLANESRESGDIIRRLNLSVE